MKLKSNFQKGFTILELVVSISIIALLTGIFLVNYRGGSSQTEIFLAAQKMASDIRFARNKALGSYKFNGAIPPGGWGIYFDRSVEDKRYYIFADNNSDRKRTDAFESASNLGGEWLDLPSNISIVSAKFNGNVVNRLDITFVPPDPVTNIYNAAFLPATTTSCSITLREINSGSESTIEINSFGLIEVKQ